MTVTATQAAAYVGKMTGRRPHVSTVIRWITRGANGRRLPGVRQGAVWLVNTIDVDEFLQPREVLDGPPPEAVQSARLELERLQLLQVLGAHRHG